jgi:hypothetical protein
MIGPSRRSARRSAPTAGYPPAWAGSQGSPSPNNADAHWRFTTSVANVSSTRPCSDRTASASARSPSISRRAFIFISETSAQAPGEFGARQAVDDSSLQVEDGRTNYHRLYRRVMKMARLRGRIGKDRKPICRGPQAHHLTEMVELPHHGQALFDARKSRAADRQNYALSPGRPFCSSRY